jgi:folate-binding protein YgfZ
MEIKTPNPVKISVSGEERFDFIQNLITNDLNKLVNILYSYILTPQGKILFEVQVERFSDHFEILCTNDQFNLFEFLNKYSRLSDVSLEKKSLDSSLYGEDYLLALLEKGRVDSNFLKHSTHIPSEIHDEYIDYQKGCYVGQEVVSRIKHRQLNKKNIKIFEISDDSLIDLSSNLKLLLELGKYKIIRLDISSDYDEILKKFKLKIINS